MANVMEDALLFHGIPLNGLTPLASQGRESLFHQGETLMRQGERADLMYVIVQGRVGVDRGHPALIEGIPDSRARPRRDRRRDGPACRQAGLLDGEPRSATVIALRF